MIQFIVTWIVMLALLAAVAATDAGKHLLYWFMWLAVIFLLVTHGAELTAALRPQDLALNG